LNKKIVVIGSTGKLGSKLLHFLSKNKIKIFATTCFKNKKKLFEQKKKYNVRNSLTLSNDHDKEIFIKLLETKIDIIYFLDYGSFSLKYLNHFLKFNKRSIIAIANKELIIAGGSILQKKISDKNNIFIPFNLIASSIKTNSFAIGS